MTRRRRARCGPSWSASLAVANGAPADVVGPADGDWDAAMRCSPTLADGPPIAAVFGALRPHARSRHRTGTIVSRGGTRRDVARRRPARVLDGLPQRARGVRRRGRGRRGRRRPPRRAHRARRGVRRGDRLRLRRPVQRRPAGAPDDELRRRARRRGVGRRGVAQRQAVATSPARASTAPTTRRHCRARSCTACRCSQVGTERPVRPVPPNGHRRRPPPGGLSELPYDEAFTFVRGTDERGSWFAADAGSGPSSRCHGRPSGAAARRARRDRAAPATARCCPPTAPSSPRWTRLPARRSSTPPSAGRRSTAATGNPNPSTAWPPSRRGWRT